MPLGTMDGDLNMDAPDGGSDGIVWAEGSNTNEGNLKDKSSAYAGVKQWDVRDIACTVGEVLVDDFIAFAFNNVREVTHIESVREVVGYNLGFPKPTWEIHLRSTSDGMDELNRMRFEDRLMDIVFTAPCIMITVTGAIIREIQWGNMGAEAPEVVVSGLAMRIEEYVQDNVWITQQGSISENQNTLYGKAGLSNGLQNDSEYAWSRRDGYSSGGDSA